MCWGKGKFCKLGGVKSCSVVYGSLGPPGARPMVQALRLPLEYLCIITFDIHEQAIYFDIAY